MKYLLLLIFTIASAKSFSQIRPRKHLPKVAAEDAYKHIGERVEVLDSIYSGKIVHDTVFFQVGEKTNTPRLIMVYPPMRHTGVTSTVDPRTIERFQHSKIYIHGIITGSAQAPQIIVDGITGHIAFPFIEGHQ